MKNQFIIFFSFMNFLSIKLSAQNPDRYICIELPGLMLNRGFPDVQQSLSVLPELITIQYCEQLGLAILKVNSTSDETEKNIARILSKNNYKYYIKKSVPIELLKMPCHLN